MRIIQAGDYRPRHQTRCDGYSHNGDFASSQSRPARKIQPISESEI